MLSGFHTLCLLVLSLVIETNLLFDLSGRPRYSLFVDEDVQKQNKPNGPEGFVLGAPLCMSQSVYSGSRLIWVQNKSELS